MRQGLINDNVYRLPLDGEYPVKPNDRKIAAIINNAVYEIMMGEPAIDQIDAIQKALDMLEK